MAAIELEPLPPREAVEFFRQKGYRMAFSWQDMPAQEHAAAFTVAKAMRLDVLKDIRGATDRAIAEQGATFQDSGVRSARSCRTRLVGQARDGRSGHRRHGERAARQRCQVAQDLRDQCATAYSEGQSSGSSAISSCFPTCSTAQLERAPSLVACSLCRPGNACRRSLVAAHMPVKEWGCKCGVLQLTARQVSQMGLEVSEAPPERYVDTRTPARAKPWMCQWACIRLQHRPGLRREEPGPSADGQSRYG